MKINNRTFQAFILLLVVAGVASAILVPAPSATGSPVQQNRFNYRVQVRASSTEPALWVRQSGAGKAFEVQAVPTNTGTPGVNGTPVTALSVAKSGVTTFNLPLAVPTAGGLTLGGVVTNAVNVEHRNFPTYATTSFTYTAAAGGTVPLFTIAAGEEWVVHGLWLEVTSNFNATGDDVTMLIGDGNDTDGFCVLADAELQAADTEGTGWSAGWQCQVAATRGVYQDGTGGFIYDEASTETIDAIIGETSGTTLSGGAATAHILYTRID